jgi:hypothetical protein
MRQPQYFIPGAGQSGEQARVSFLSAARPAEFAGLLSVSPKAFGAPKRLLGEVVASEAPPSGE